MRRAGSYIMHTATIVPRVLCFEDSIRMPCGAMLLARPQYSGLPKLRFSCWTELWAGSWCPFDNAGRAERACILCIFIAPATAPLLVRGKPCNPARGAGLHFRCNARPPALICFVHAVPLRDNVPWHHPLSHHHHYISGRFMFYVMHAMAI